MHPIFCSVKFFLQKVDAHDNYLYLTDILDNTVLPVIYKKRSDIKCQDIFPVSRLDKINILPLCTSENTLRKTGRHF